MCIRDRLLEDGYYLLDENSGQQGTGPQRFISLEEDTQGPDSQYESIPIVDTVVGMTSIQTTGWLILQEDGSGGILYEDDSSTGSSSYPSGERILTEYSHLTTTEEGRIKGVELEQLYVNHESMSLLDRMLMESGDVLEMEDNSQIIQEGDPSVLMPDKEVEFDLYESLGWHIKGEDDSYITNEDTTRALLELSNIELGDNPGSKTITQEGSTKPAITRNAGDFANLVINDYKEQTAAAQFGMQVFRPHYTSQWSDALTNTDLGFTRNELELEAEVGSLLLEDDVIDSDYLLLEDFPQIYSDLISLGEPYYEYIQLEDQGAGNNILTEEGDSQILMEFSRVTSDEFTVFQAWKVLPSYQYSRMLTRLSGQISIPHNSCLLYTSPSPRDRG